MILVVGTFSYFLIAGLALQCEEYLLTTMRPETAVEAYLCAVDYNLEIIRKRAAHEIMSNLQVSCPR